MFPRITLETISASGREKRTELFPIAQYDAATTFARQLSRDFPALQVRLLFTDIDEATDGADYLSGFQNVIARYCAGNRIG